MNLTGNAETSYVLKGKITAIPGVDKTLTKEGLAADAKATGDAVQRLQDSVNASNAAEVFAHLESITNPHKVTARQVGLGNVDNTSDADKPVSTAQAATFVAKEDGKGLSANDFTNAYKAMLDGTADMPEGGEYVGGVKNGGEIEIDALGQMHIKDDSVATPMMMNGSVTVEKLSNGFALPTEKLANAAVTRAKLANDALYSPIQDWITTRTLTVADIGKTMKGDWNKAMTLTLTQANSAQMPVGAEIAVFNYSQDAGAGTKIVGDGVRFFMSGDNANYTSATIKIADAFGMIALKKFSTNTNLGDGWLVTGNVEVV